VKKYCIYSSVNATQLWLIDEAPGNPLDKSKASAIVFFKKKVLCEEAKVYGQPDHGCA
jgi:hypothetical protein